MGRRLKVDTNNRSSCCSNRKRLSSISQLLLLVGLIVAYAIVMLIFMDQKLKVQDQIIQTTEEMHWHHHNNKQSKMPSIGLKQNNYQTTTTEKIGSQLSPSRNDYANNRYNTNRGNNKHNAESNNKHNHKIISSPITKTIPKPRLILHVGIMKTGTTYIQLELLRKKRWNRVYKKLLLDNYEVITQEYAPHTFEKVIDECLIKGEAGCNNNKQSQSQNNNYQLWQDLIDLYDTAKGWNDKDHLIQSLETFSLIPKPFNDLTKQLFYELNHKYDVHIVVFYRRLYEWIISLYTQYRKPLMYRTKDSDNPWKQDYDNRDINGIKLLPEWLESIIESNSFHYTTSTADEFISIFGKDKVTVLDYHEHKKHGLEVEFICMGIPNATHACEESKLIAQEHQNNPNKADTVKQNTGDQYLPDHDLLVIEAYNEKLISIGRHNATLVLESKLHKMNMTISQLPRKCLSSERHDWLESNARYAENSFSSNPLTEEDLMIHFKKYKDKLCSVDAPAVMKNSTWKKLFSSCEFQKDGCS